MLLLRSLTVGLLGACVVLLARVHPAHPVVHHVRHLHVAPDVWPQPRAPAQATIVDVAPGVVDVAALVALGPGEHVVAVGDHTVASDLVAGAVISTAPRGPGRFLDLTVEGPTTSRRVLVLMH